MPKRDVALLLEDIVAALGKIERYTDGLSREAFLARNADLADAERVGAAHVAEAIQYRTLDRTQRA